MRYYRIPLLALSFLCTFAIAHAQSSEACVALAESELTGVEITKANLVPAGTSVPPPYRGAPNIGPLPAQCRVDGIVNRRKGAGGQEFGIGFAIALPGTTAWNGDFMMQGGGGGNGIVAYPAGANYAGDTPAVSRGFAVVSTDTGHKAKIGPFDFSFMRDQQAYLGRSRPLCAYPKRAQSSGSGDTQDARNFRMRIWREQDELNYTLGPLVSLVPIQPGEKQ